MDTTGPFFKKHDYNYIQKSTSQCLQATPPLPLLHVLGQQFLPQRILALDLNLAEL